MTVRSGLILMPMLFALCAQAVGEEQYEWGASYPSADSFHPPVKQPNPACGRFVRSPATLGPVDYRTVSPYTVVFVEVRHFTREVELLQRGKKATVAGDLHYMLFTFPNHPRALRSMSELLRRTKGIVPPELVYGFDCWFDRALAYRPDDVDVRVVYASELIKNGKLDLARQQAAEIEPLLGDNPRFSYNLGLIYYDLQEYERAQALAKKAYSLGVAFPGLKDKLARIGKWSDR
jgi:tetratricopeptide (TPR) repeat protein